MLVNCVAYHRGQKLSDIPLSEVRSHLERADCFVWVALKDPQPEELAAGVYGMNFAIMPKLQWSYGYPAAVATMGLIDLYLVYRFKRAKWM